jgi:hypothetical protein
MNIPDELKKLADLRDAGAISEAEFAVAKERVLRGSTPPPIPAPASVARPPSPFRGPPHECWNCGGPLRKGREAKNQGVGCIIMILGIFLLPLYGLGLLVILYGMHLSGKAETYWQCKRCDSKFPRKVKWYQIEIG